MTGLWNLPFIRPVRTALASPKLRRWLSLTIMVLSIGILLVILLRDAQSLRAYDNWQSYIGVCVVGIVLYILPLSAQLAVWSWLMKRLGQVRHGWWNVEIFSYSHLLRRLPGSVWYIVSRTTMYHTLGVDMNVPVIASGIEWMLLLVSSAIVLLLFGLIDSINPFALVLLSASVFLVAAVALHWLFQFGTNLHLGGRLGGWLTRFTSVTTPRVLDVVAWLVLYSAAYVVGGMILFFLVRVIDPNTTASFIFSVKAWALTGGLGTLLSFVIPAGFGLRELTLVAVMLPTTSASAAALVSILLRVLFMVSDIIWGGSLWLVARAAGRNKAYSDVA